VTLIAALQHRLIAAPAALLPAPPGLNTWIPNSEEKAGSRQPLFAAWLAGGLLATPAVGLDGFGMGLFASLSR
jgi:hypothetical protein